MLAPCPELQPQYSLTLCPRRPSYQYLSPSHPQRQATPATAQPLPSPPTRSQPPAPPCRAAPSSCKLGLRYKERVSGNGEPQDQSSLSMPALLLLPQALSVAQTLRLSPRVGMSAPHQSTIGWGRYLRHYQGAPGVASACTSSGGRVREGHRWVRRDGWGDGEARGSIHACAPNPNPRPPNTPRPRGASTEGGVSAPTLA
jgi:hypothetical protein